MSAAEEEARANELVIIRRRGGGEDAPHKGGVWKIAYADFMTAMMAFFLVMWLINATDQRVITQVATYFNPLKLTDKSPHQRGLHESDLAAQSDDGVLNAGKGKTEAKADRATSDKSKGNKSDHLKGDDNKKAEKKATRGEAQYPEATLYRDPQGTLDKLAEAAQRVDAVAGERSGEVKGTGGIAYRNPFEPAPRQADAAAKPTERTTAPSEPAPANDAGPAGQAKSALAPVGGKEAAVRAEQKEAAVRAEQEAAAARAAAAGLDGELRQAIAQSAGGLAPRLDVAATEEGLLISLTDDYDFGMFAVASAEPRPAMVVVMEKIAKVLARQTEPLIVRGHTDGRPYRTGAYDNWRLSTARAHMAYLMLLRGGIAEARFERIEGRADRQPKIPSDRDAAQNRRIEILLRKSKS
ncbi:MAG TPA: MotB family protein [Hyphomicrobiaceae bacterium]|nr:MotB family protein [Hyphomicrobiaceae bacterium]